MKNKTFPIIPDGFIFIIPCAVPAIVLLSLKITYAGFFFLAVTLFVMWFFRNPDRITPADKRAIISPADGRVIKIEELHEKEMLNEKVIKVSIFMSIFNVHVNRGPCTGTIKKIIYSEGKFFPASLDKASALNERCSILIETLDKNRILTIQIAGIIARRIVWWVKEGMQIKKGERFGLIKFGSRLEVFMPLDTTIHVKVGDKVKAGETRIGYLI
ncbi:MAG: phosphatidylserine decarboxylase family protein [Thermodesulfobacteriota bacterium]|nr:phosphatidylserine decarboxylase family protein [Thermodesulfobacteriota bacterium]